MKEYLDGQDLLNDLLMDTTTTFFLVLEGEDDYEFWCHHVADPDCLVVGYGKPSVVEAAVLADSAGFETALFLVDLDFDRITGAALAYPPNLIPTDNYDLAIDLLTGDPDLVRRLAFSLASPLVLASVFPRGADVLIDAAWRAAEYVGACRLANALRGWGLNSSRFPMRTVIDELDGDLPAGSILDLLESRSSMTIPDRNALELDISAALAGDRRYLANEHDFLKALSAAIDKNVGSPRGKSAVLLRAIVGCAEFHAAPMFSRVASAGPVLH